MIDLMDVLLYIACFVFGLVFNRIIIQPLKNYIVKRMSPGIIQKYLEEMLGLNKQVPVPPVIITPLSQIPAAPVVAPAPIAPVASTADVGYVPIPPIAPQVIMAPYQAPVAVPPVYVPPLVDPAAPPA